MAGERLSGSSGNSDVETECYSLIPESSDLEYLHLINGKLVWKNDLESLQKFVENGLELQGKWLTPGGSTKQFKSSNGNIIINWYYKKQHTLNFQGRDGPALKDKLLELVHKKPGETTEMLEANYLSSSENVLQSSTLFQETDSGQRILQSSTDGECPLNVEVNTKLLSKENIQNQDENALGVELLDYKKRCEKLSSTISNKDNAIKDLEEKCLFFESRALSLEQENDSLKLALSIIMREKGEVDNNQQKSRDCWSVEKPQPRRTNANHSQETTPANVIQTRNRFEPLRDDKQIQRNASNRKGNNNVQEHRTSSSSSEIRSHNTGSVNSTNQHNHLQSNRKKKVVIAGDSTLKYLQGHKMSKNSQVKIATFPGCTTQDMNDHIKPLLRRNPDEIIVS
ncbi:hypothetical protein ACROYT_G001352 [Oculina patagonica]